MRVKFCNDLMGSIYPMTVLIQLYFLFLEHYLNSNTQVNL